VEKDTRGASQPSDKPGSHPIRQKKRSVRAGDREIGQRLRQFRKTTGLTQREVVVKLEWRWRKKLSRYETGESEVTLEDARALADLYGISLDWIAGRTAHPSGLEPGSRIVHRPLFEALIHRQELDPTLDLIHPLTVPDDPLVVSPEEAEAMEYVVRALLGARGAGPRPDPIRDGREPD
jgi:transcriptional regulator with XRE-family HTH domain